MTHIIGKVWGTTSLMYRSPVLEVHSLVILPNSYCSLHMHTVKNNSFYVSKGVLFIETHKKSYDLVDLTQLGKGDFTTVGPGEYHRFFTEGEGAEVLEIYHVEPLSDDIVRKGHGGRNDDKDSLV